ncbi:MAG: hypothetical protein QOI78_4525, partial [Actinomycetota bacterium]|nr:hypothetical protein [Actinomycetota bacterium]
MKLWKAAAVSSIAVSALLLAGCTGSPKTPTPSTSAE